jgi:hypothetical protein
MYGGGGVGIGDLRSVVSTSRVSGLGRETTGAGLSGCGEGAVMSKMIVEGCKEV